MKLADLLNEIENISQVKGLSRPFIVGGIPRDKILGRQNKFEDVDITTGDDGVSHLAKEVAIKLNEYVTGYAVMADGHARVKFGDLKIDFSSNFMIPGIGYLLRKINIVDTDSMEKEIYSRDFTCNTLLMTLDLKTIKDPTGQALSDIDSRLIKTCLPPKLTLGYDHNRIIRAVYLAAKLDFNLDPEMIEWIKSKPEAIKTVSKDYIGKKLYKAMSVNRAKTLKLLKDLELWDLLPEDFLALQKAVEKVL